MKKKKSNTFKKLITSCYSGCDPILLVVIIVLVCFGIIMCFSASAPSAQANYGDSYHYVKRQILWSVLGFVGMSAATLINCETYRKHSVKFLALSLLLVAVTLAMPAVNGAKRWLGIGGFGIQPSEMLKIAVIIFMADTLAKQEWATYDNSIGDFFHNYITDLKKYIIALLVSVGLLYLQPHISCILLICVVACVMLLVGGIRMKYVLTTAVAVIPVGIFLIKQKGYALERLASYLDPFKYAQDEGYQIVQSFYAIGSGGLFGLGIGQSRQKYLYIPEPQNDFIFSIICEELGFIGALAVILLFAVLIYRGIVAALNSKSTYCSLIAVGITTLIATQVFVNIGVVTGLVPVTGMALPFFSYGGSSFIFMLISMGILLNISKKR